MKFLDFLEQAKNKDFWLQQKVICFKGKNYPFLFLGQVFDFLENKGFLPFAKTTLNLESVEKIKLKAELQQSFLGQRAFYWLGECSVGASDKGSLEIFDFLVNYQGPHIISFFLSDEKLTAKTLSVLKKIDFIEIDEKIDKNLLAKLLAFFEYSFSFKKIDLIQKIAMQASNMSLDQFCLLARYLELVNDKMLPNCQNYFASIILMNEQPSLFKLSDHFFARQPEPFFNIWSSVHNDYPEMFWLSFWSEQIWKAYHVVNFLKKENFAAARSMSFRLPFMFIKRDWMKFSLNELANAFNFLYTIDFTFKTGSVFCALDLFYFNHFMKKNA